MLRNPTLKFNYNRRIVSANDIPDWYSREKYNDMINLSNKECYQQLYIRQNCLAALQLIGSSKKIPESLIKILALIRAQPIVDLNSNQLLQDTYSCIFQSWEKLNNDSLSNLSIHPTTVHELYLFEQRLAEAQGDSARKHYAETYQHPAVPNTQKHEEWFYKPITELINKTNTSTALFTANLDQPDTMLIEQFANALTLARKTSGTVPKDGKFHSLSPSKIIRYNVLPFLDLHIWQVETQTMIEEELLIQVIYPSQKRGYEQIQTTYSNALAALNINKLEHFIQKHSAS